MRILITLFMASALWLSQACTLPPTPCDLGDLSCKSGTLDLYFLTSVAATASVTCSNSSFCYTFFSDNLGAGYDGNLGGVSGADAKCAATKPAGLPGIGSDYKALIGVTNGQRHPSPAIDWVFRANKDYRRQDGTQIFVTDSAGMFPFPGPTLTNPFFTAASTVSWTGLITGSYPWSVAGNCSEFTSTTGTGYAGSNAVNSNAFGGGPYNCDRTAGVTTYGIICVQQ